MHLKIGIVGLGNFARFAANVFLKVPGINIIAVTDIDNNLTGKMANEWGATGYKQYEDFLADTRIELVYIATPPYLHYQQSKLALLKGKHVICEKPAALHTSEAIELASMAASLGLLWIVNLMQRYNPMYSIVEKIIEEKILGSFLHGFFENYASDENLGPGHWFWDESKSGGIFIEHGVHFFDMFSGWLDEGKMIHAVEMQRQVNNNKIVDRVQATVMYKEGLVNFYHGFDQPKILDRQEMRLQFEKGEITLDEWVPVKMRLHGLLKNEHLERFQELTGGFSIVHQQEKTDDKKIHGRFFSIDFDKEVTLEFGDASAKQHCYEALLSAMIKDQMKWITNRDHKRIIDETNAVSSLAMAEAANNFAKKHNRAYE